MSRRPERTLRGDKPLLLLSLLLTTAACTGGGGLTRCPDGSHVSGECHLAPDGTYFGDAAGRPEDPAAMPEDVADDTADRAAEEANEQSGLIPVEVTEIEIGSN